MLVKKKMEYLGIEKPDTPAQVRVEIAGLKQLIKSAEEQICRLEQAMALVVLEHENALKREAANESQASTSENKQSQKE